ncbi:MAG: peptide chain release factor N(5)-glutamine methyltransferase [Candidatus Omnitrophota bacterium]|jgi:release factor glutamine methyltransferase
MNESQLLFTQILNCSLDQLYLERERRLNPKEAGFLLDAFRRRLRFEPIQYILGKTEFMGEQFRLTPDVFIPRPETEILVETVIDYTNRRPPIAYRILELGTGSGCIAISLAKLLPNFKITATDISQAALNLAKENARLHNLDDKINFVRSNLCESLPKGDMKFGICVANPPYIPTAEIGSLEPELGYEPRIAFDGGLDGLDFYRRIIVQVPAYLKRGSFLILEMGHNQCAEIKDLFCSNKNFQIVQVVSDYHNIERVIVARSRYG